MRKTKSLQKSQSGGFNAFRDYIGQVREQQFKELVEQAKRIGAAARNRRKLLESLAQKTGFDLSAIDALHARDWETILKQAGKHAKDNAALFNQERARQTTALRTITKHRSRFEYKKGNPHTSLCRWRAVQAPSVTINPQTFNDGLVEIVDAPAAAPVRVGQNIMRLSVRVSANLSHGLHLSPAAAVDIFTEHVFEAEVPHDGVLSVIGNYAPAGNIFIGAPGDCVLPGSASAEVLLFMFVEVDTANGGRIEMPLGTTTTIVDREVDATCDGTNRMIRVGTSNGVAFQLAHNGIIAVEAGDLVRVRAGMDVFLRTALGGGAQAIFAPQPFGINVPMVVFKIDS